MLIDKQEIPQVAMNFMNEVHDEDVKIINTLFELLLAYEKEPNDENFNAINDQYKHWYAHTIEHFKGEEVKMRELNFPPYPMHKSEHDNALQRMDEVYKDFKEHKNIQALKIYFIEEVPTWLMQHIQTMDNITATFFSTGSMSCASH